MRRISALAILAFAGGAMAAEAVLVHDIAPPHPRYTQLTQMAAEVAKRTQGTLTIAINVAELVSRGAMYTAVPGDAVAAWRERTGGVTRDFSAGHPEVIRRFRAIVGAE